MKILSQNKQFLILHSVVSACTGVHIIFMVCLDWNRSCFWRAHEIKKVQRYFFPHVKRFAFWQLSLIKCSIICSIIIPLTFFWKKRRWSSTELLRFQIFMLLCQATITWINDSVWFNKAILLIERISLNFLKLRNQYLSIILA